MNRRTFVQWIATLLPSVGWLGRFVPDDHSHLFIEIKDQWLKNMVPGDDTVKKNRFIVTCNKAVELYCLSHTTEAILMYGSVEWSITLAKILICVCKVPSTYDQGYAVIDTIDWPIKPGFNFNSKLNIMARKLNQIKNEKIPDGDNTLP